MSIYAGAALRTRAEINFGVIGMRCSNNQGTGYMETIDIKLPYSEVALILDALRHYIHYIENVTESDLDEDSLADLLNDNENVKAIEKEISALFLEKIGPY